MSIDNIAIKRAEMEMLANSPFASEMEKANAKFFNDFVDKNGYLNGYNYNTDTYDIQNQDTMNLQDAILETLKSNGKPMTCQEIADSLNSSKLYERGRRRYSSITSICKSKQLSASIHQG